MADDWVEAGFTTIFAVAPRLDSTHPDANFADFSGFAIACSKGTSALYSVGFPVVNPTYNLFHRRGAPTCARFNHNIYSTIFAVPRQWRATRSN
ncbi:MAG: hypothetical protein RID53_21920 [Coleofasciculus sp. B1-GNL1-01]|uniref:hypothetical protein n=1 Tax=Coleofasciculus sp. B1-GNL1-01 TaxID=3068484 RepID=UPI0032FD12CA